MRTDAFPRRGIAQYHYIISEHETEETSEKKENKTQERC